MKTRLLVGAVVAALFAVTANAQNRAFDGTAQIDLGNQGADPFSNRALTVQNFEDIAARPDAAPGANGVCALSASFAAAGWFAKNNSTTPLGTSCLSQGYSSGANAANQFPAQAGGANSFAGMSFSATTGANTISVWLVSPVVTFTANSSLVFWTRGIPNAAGTAQSFPDRLQVRTSTVSAGTPNVGNAPADVGDFTNLALDLNPGLTTAIAACPAAGLTNPGATVAGYPMTTDASRWCRITLNGAGGGLPTSGQGRIAFRYFVTDGGPAGANSFHIGIDSFSFEDGAVVGPVVSSPINTLSTYGLGLLGLILAGVGVAAVRRFA